jgi:hypothetical protein
MLGGERGDFHHSSRKIVRLCWFSRLKRRGGVFRQRHTQPETPKAPFPPRASVLNQSFLGS